MIGHILSESYRYSLVKSSISDFRLALLAFSSFGLIQGALYGKLVEDVTSWPGGRIVFTQSSSRQELQESSQGMKVPTVVEKSCPVAPVGLTTGCQVRLPPRMSS